jgi:hypothetical protein
MTTTNNRIEYRRQYWSWIYQEAAEMAALAGLKKAPIVKVVGVDEGADVVLEYDPNNNPGDKNGHYKGRAYIDQNLIIIKPTHSPFPALRIGSTRFTIAHEIIHLKYPRLEHGHEFEDRTAELVKKWKNSKNSKKNQTRPAKINRVVLFIVGTQRSIRKK